MKLLGKISLGSWFILNPVSALGIIESEKLRKIAEEVSEKLRKVIEKL